MNNSHNRRRFVKQALTLSVLPILPAIAKASVKTVLENVDPGYKFLFQGDSITDGGRGRNLDWNHVLGQDYVYLIASRLWYDHVKSDFHFFNRGIGGNKITDLASRWQQDTLDIKPDLLSIMVGVNDVSAFAKGDNNFSVENYKQRYRALLDDTIAKLPHIQIVICEPFYLVVNSKKRENFDVYAAEFDKYRQAARQLSIDYNTIFVPFQDVFNRALKKAPAEYWIWDGVHPMPAGHELMAREWIHHVEKKLKFIR
ncbi:SGNH/GDSL hydrolase family protein [Mucilaginibacter terrae]|uniref:SGNH/GDSL hydrolase family protein n=1 Tax=Mucilaginibacter terrae TaxID=1955052 RepID=UPI003631CDEC